MGPTQISLRRKQVPLLDSPPHTRGQRQSAPVSGLKRTRRGLVSVAAMQAYPASSRISQDQVTLPRLTITPPLCPFRGFGKNSRRSMDDPTSTCSAPLKTTSLKLMLSTHPSRHFL